MRDFAVTLLAELGYQVTAASDGIEARAIVEREGLDGFQLLLTDVVMPRLGGAELAQELRALRGPISPSFSSPATRATTPRSRRFSGHTASTCRSRSRRRFWPLRCAGCSTADGTRRRRRGKKRPGRIVAARAPELHRRGELLEHVDVLRRADLLELLRPDRDADLAEVRLPQQVA